MKVLVVVDMQNDFITGSLGSAAAQAIVAGVAEKVRRFDGTVIFTRDTHGTDYAGTQEGQKLPVSHCIRNTPGWEICDALRSQAENVVDKITFGSTELPGRILSFVQDAGEIEEIELCGLCTDICVISNAMILKAAFPEVRICIDSASCAGVTPESHETALRAMSAVQIEVY